MVTIDRRTGWHQPSHLPRIRSQWRWQWRDTLPSKTSGTNIDSWHQSDRGISQSDTKIRSTQKTMGNLHAIHGYSWIFMDIHGYSWIFIHYFDWPCRNQLWWFHQDADIHLIHLASCWISQPSDGSLRSIHHIMNMGHGIEDGVLLSRKGLWYNML